MFARHSVGTAVGGRSSARDAHDLPEDALLTAGRAPTATRPMRGSLSRDRLNSSLLNQAYSGALGFAPMKIVLVSSRCRGWVDIDRGGRGASRIAAY